MEGEVTSKFFHSVVKGRKKRLALKKMKKDTDRWVERDDDITNESISFFQRQYTRERFHSDFSPLSCIPKLIDEEENERLIEIPTMEEIKEVVFLGSSQSAPGPDGVSGKFYHSCWEIRKEDLLLMIFYFLHVLKYLRH